MLDGIGRELVQDKGKRLHLLAWQAHMWAWLDRDHLTLSGVSIRLEQSINQRSEVGVRLRLERRLVRRCKRRQSTHETITDS